MKKSGSEAISRRSVIFAPLVLAAQTRRPAILILWSGLPAVPDPLASECVVFPRAYAACPQPEAARRALETGRFPHALHASDPTLESLFGGGYRLAIVATVEETVRLANAAAESIVVFAGAPNGREVHVPLAIRWRGVLAARVAAEIQISQTDVLPTLVALAGVESPGSAQGRDLSGVLRGARSELPDSVYVEGSSGAKTEWRAVIRGFDKLVFNLREEVLGLYNIADDPLERNNLAKEAGRDPALKLTRDGLLALARVWMRRVEDGRDSTGVRVR